MVWTRCLTLGERRKLHHWNPHVGVEVRLERVRLTLATSPPLETYPQEGIVGEDFS